MKIYYKWNFKKEVPLLSSYILLDNSKSLLTSISQLSLSPNVEDRDHSVCFLCLHLNMSIKAKSLSFKSAQKKMQNMMMEIKVELI